MQAFDDWLAAAGLSDRQFVETYYQKLPLAAHGAAAAAGEIATWETLANLVAAEGADVFVCRENVAYTGELPRSAATAEELCRAGYTLRVRHAERHDPRLAALAASFSEHFLGAINLHVYATPPQTFGFSWHYDAEDVFILQTAGQKVYQLRKNTVQPWPLGDALPDDMHYEREIMPLMQCQLSAGDWLYLPAGYWHKANSREFSISIAVGILSPTLVDALDFARQRLLASLAVRQRLPIYRRETCQADAERRAALTERLAQLKHEFNELVDSAAFQEQLFAHLTGRDLPATPHDAQDSAPATS